MNRLHESFDSSFSTDKGNETTLPDFMLQNFERDPTWFVEPENTPEYGPPGMPTPWSPLDPRIAPRQHYISDTLRSLLNPNHLPVSLDKHQTDMLQMNFDSFNTILGQTNNDSYVKWKSRADSDDLSPELQRIESLGVLGLADQAELAYFLQNIKEPMSVEFSRLYHPFKYRMRHLQYRREETNEMIINAGGELYDNDGDSQYYGLKLFPYVVESARPLTIDEEAAIDLLQQSIFRKWKVLHQQVNDDTSAVDVPEGHTPSELYSAISDAIDDEEAEILKIHESTQVLTVEGLMASIKRHVGVIPKTDEREISVTERQLFAIDISAQKHTQEFQDAMLRIRTGGSLSGELEKCEEIKQLFLDHSQLIIPVSTTTYGFETQAHTYPTSATSAAIGQMATGRTSRLRS